MGVCGTPFEIADMRVEIRALADRIQRARVPDDDGTVLHRLCNDENAVALRCSDGLVVMCIKAEGSGRITAELALGVSFGDLDAFRRNEEHLATIARDFGATRLVFETYRHGWFRLLGDEWTFDGKYFVRSV